MPHLLRVGLLCVGLVLLAPGAARAACGQDNQPPCGGGCNWIVKGVCPLCIPWCAKDPYFCRSGNELKTEYVVAGDQLVALRVCRKPPTPPPPPPLPCDSACQAQKINQALGHPVSASMNRTQRISRQEAGIPSSDSVHLDLGGEGAHHFQSRCDGFDRVVNVNPSKVITGGPSAGSPIPNLVLAYGQNLPFQNAFADKVTAQSVPFNADWAEEMARVIKPGGRIAVCGTLEESGHRKGLAQLQAHGLHIAETNDFGLGRREVVFNVPPSYAYSPVARPPPTCGIASPLAQALSGSTSAAGGCEIDMMVLYTEAALAEASSAQKNIEQIIRERVDGMNEALQNTGLQERIRLVHIGKTAYDEAELGRDMKRMLDNLSGLGSSSKNTPATEELHALRSRLGADLVSLFVTQVANIDGVGGSACGVGSDTLTRETGFSVIRWQCSTTNNRYALAHEAGHNLGLHHDRYTLGKENDPQFDPTGYNYGFSSTEGSGFWTIMGYATKCAAFSKQFCSLIPYYSSPDNFRNGIPMGNAQANNKKAIRENAPTVAGYTPRASALVFSPESLVFTPQKVLGTEKQTVGLYNTTPNDVQIKALSVTAAGTFTLVGTESTCKAGVTLQRQQGCTVSISFTPPALGEHTATLNVSFEGLPGVSLALEGKGLSTAPALAVQANREDVDPGTPIDFGNAPVAETQSIQLGILNRAPGELHVTSLTVPAGAAFRVSTDGLEPSQICQGFPGPFVVRPHDSCFVTLSLKPTHTGSVSSTLTLRSNDPTSPVLEVPLHGFGVTVKDEL